MLHMGPEEGYQKMPDKIVQGIPCLGYNGTIKLNQTDLLGNLRVEYYWNCKHYRPGQPKWDSQDVEI